MINVPSDSVMNRILSRAAQMKGGVKGGLKANSATPETIEEATADMGQAIVPEAMTMEMAMLTPVTPERAFNSPLDSTRNGPRATTFNAPRPSTFNGPRPSTMNGPRLPEPMIGMEMDEPMLPPMPAPGQPFVPPMVNGQEDWGSQVYDQAGAMRPIDELRQLPPRVQGAITQQNPLLQSYFPQTPRLEPAQATGTPEDMATMARYQGGLGGSDLREAILWRSPEDRPIRPARTELDGMPFDPNAFGPQPDIDPNRDMTIDMGDGPVRMMGKYDPIVSPERRRATLEQDLSDAILAEETSSL